MSPHASTNQASDKIARLLEVLGDGTTTCNTTNEIWARIESFGEEIYPGLTSVVGSENEDIATLALGVLKEAASCPTEIDMSPMVHPAMLALDHKSKLVRISAIAFLGAMSGKAMESIPRLLEISDCDDEYLSACAASAVLSIAPTQLECLKHRLFTLLASDDTQVRNIIVDSLGHLGGLANEFLSALQQLTESDETANSSALAIFRISNDPSYANKVISRLLASNCAIDIGCGKEMILAVQEILNKMADK